MKKRKNDTPKLIVKKTDVPTLSGDEVGVKTEFYKGTVYFSSISFPLAYAKKNAAKKNKKEGEVAGVGLKWQGYGELQEDHGLAVTFEVLCAKSGCPLSENGLEKMSNEIAQKIGEDNWIRVEKFISTLDEESINRKIFIQAGWAELFAEPFEELWLASMAQHAYYVLEDGFAFGYLTALLDQKRNIESLFLRGKKNLEASQLGGKLKPRTISKETESVLKAMKQLISKGHPIANAARLAFNNGFGSSKDANRKLWARHSTK